MSVTALDKAIKDVCPIYGVSIGDPADKTTWRVDYDPSATSDQRAAAVVVVSGFDYTASGVSEALIASALDALDDTDMVAQRCFKAGIVFPSEWLTYVTALRTIVRNGTGSLPSKPAYPQGT